MATIDDAIQQVKAMLMRPEYKDCPADVILQGSLTKSGYRPEGIGEISIIYNSITDARRTNNEFVNYQ